MATVDIGKLALPALGIIGAVVAGSIIYNYAKQQGWTGGFRATAMPGQIITDAGSRPAYGRFSPKFRQGYPQLGPERGSFRARSYPGYGQYSPFYQNDIPGFGPEYAYSSRDPFNSVGRTSQSQRESGMTFGANPALSNIDRNYDRVFTDRFP